MTCGQLIFSRSYCTDRRSRQCKSRT